MQSVRRDAHTKQSVSKIKTKAMLQIRRIAFVFINALSHVKSITSTLLHKVVTALAITSLFVPGSVLVLGLNNKALAAESTYINFQARILQASGALVPDGTYHIEFKLYDVDTSGTALWTETRSPSTSPTADRAVVKNGYVSVRLGAITSFPSTINWDQQLYLGMNIGGTAGSASWDGEMTPRFVLTAVPYAKEAKTAAGVTSNNTNATSTNSDAVSISTGNAAGATSNSGAITIDTGTATGTAGAITIGGTNSSGITLGRSGIQTSVAGNILIQGATVNSTLAITDKATGGAIGTAAATVDIYTSATVNQTTAGQTLTIPTPTSTTAGRMFYLSNIGTASFTLLGTTINSGTTAALIWTGSAWQFTGADGSGILNQNSSNQTANFRITGTGQANTSFLAPTLDVASAGTLSLGNTTATAITLGKAGITTTNSGALTVSQLLTGSLGATISGADISLNASSNFNTNINTGTSTGTVTIGNNTGNTPIVINSGTGSISIGTGAQARTIDIGTGAAVVQTINIGGTGANVIGIGNTQTGGSVSIGAAMTTGTITIGGTGLQTGTIALGTGTGAQTINLGTGGTGAKTVTLGSTASTSSTTIDSGTGAINIGTGAQDRSINIGTGAAAQTVVVGSTNTTSTTTINSGTGNITLQAAGTSTIGVVQIGAGGAGSTTPDYFALDVKSTTGDPAGGAEGYMYYNTFDNKFRCYQGSAWVDCIGAGGSNLFTDGGTFTYLTDTAEDFILGGSTVASAKFFFDVSASTLYVGSDNTGSGGADGVITLYSSGSGVADPTIAANSTGDITIQSTAGSVILGDNSGGIQLSLVAQADVFTASKTFTAASSYSLTDYSFTRTATGGANALSGSVLYVNDASTTSSTNTANVLNINAPSASTGNLIIATTGGSTERFKVTAAGNTTVGGTLAVTGNVTANANLTAGSGAGVGVFTNNGSTVNTTLAISNLATGGAIGTAAATVDIYTSASLAQTTASQTITVPTPTASTSYGRVFYLSNIGTVSFTLLGTTVNPGTTASLIWSNTNGGASWQFSGADGNGILNQNTATQTANFQISGTGVAATFTASTINSSGALSIASGGTNTNTTINAVGTGQVLIGGTSTGDILLGGGSASTGCTVTNSTGAFACTSTINGATLSSTAVNGLTFSGTAITGSGALAITAGGTNTGLTLNGNGTGTVTIGGTSTGDILLGGGSASTGCTLTNSTGAFACASTINGATISSGAWNGSTIGVAYGGTGTSTAFTQGSILFAGASGVYSQDNSNFFWDNTAKELGIGTATPGMKLDVLGTAGDGEDIARFRNGSGSIYLKLGYLTGTANMLMSMNGAGTASQDLYIGGFGTGAVANFRVSATASRISGTLNVVGAATMDSTLNVTGAVTMSSTLSVTTYVSSAVYYDSSGTTYLLDPSNTGTSLRVAGNSILGGCLIINTTTCSGTINASVVPQNAYLKGNFSPAGNNFPQASVVFDNIITAADTNSQIRANLWVDSTYSPSVSGTIPQMTGLHLNTRNGVGTVTSGTGTLTNQYGLWVRNDTAAGNTTTNSYGIFVAASTASGTITNQYGIYQAGGSDSNYFAGQSVFNGNLLAATPAYSTTTTQTNSVCRSGAVFGYYFLGNCSSLAKYKDEVQNLPYGLETIRQLRPVQYRWNIDGNYLDTGFIAEEVNAVAPIFNEYENGKITGVKYDHMVALAINGVKIIDEQVQAMEGRLAVLESGILPELNVTGDAEIGGSLTVTGDTYLQNITINGKIITAGNAPAIALGDAANGDGASATVTGNDIAGTVSFRSGSINLPTNALGAGKQVEITFNKPYTNIPRVNLTPTSEAAASIKYFVERTATGMIIKFAEAPAENLDYIFDYQIMQ